MKVSGGLLVIVLFAVPLAGCGKKMEIATPQPSPDGSAADRDREERARREAAERARIAEEERVRAEEAAHREAVMAARSTLAEMIYFDFDDAQIRGDAEAVLNAKVRVLREYPQVRIRIAGHCDERGSNEYNLALGSRRASSVLSYLEAAGIGAGRFEIISYGEERPQAQGHDEGAWSRNRRAEFEVLSGLEG